MKMAGRMLLALVPVLAMLAVSPGSAAGQGSVLCGGVPATMVGTAGDDVLHGTEGDDVIAALQGSDRVYGHGGNDIICGGIGNDHLTGGLGFDVIYGAQGDDVISAQGDDPFLPEGLTDDLGSRIFAGAGNDIVFGSNRWDRMQGGPGNDILYGFAGVDWMRGGPGDDIVMGHEGADDIGGGTGHDTMGADSKDKVVRSGAGNDACPSITVRATQWRGCLRSFATSQADPTLPAVPFPAALAGGPADTYVYLGVNNAGDRNSTYVGITTNLLGRAIDHLEDPEPPTFHILQLNVRPLTNGQARAIEQSIIADNPQFVNKINSISPTHSYYDEAVAWGDAWRALNPWFQSENWLTNYRTF